MKQSTKLITLLAFAAMLLSSFTYAMEVQAEEENLEDLEGVKYQCSFLEKNKIFSYKPAEDRLPDDQFKAPIDDALPNFVYFSFCNDSNITCSNLSDEDVRGSAIVRDDTDPENPGRCIRVSEDNWNDVNVTLIKNEDDRSKDYLSLEWQGIDNCEFGQPDEKWHFTVDVVCVDKPYNQSTFTYNSGFDNTCNIKTTIESKLGCAIVDFNAIWEFLQENSTYFAIGLIVVGLFLCLGGYRLFIVSLFLAGMFATIVAICLIAYQFVLSKDVKPWVGWVILAVSAVIGAMVGYSVAKFRKVGVFLLACWGGACLGLLLNNAVMRYAESQALFWVVIAACGLVAGIVSCVVFVPAAIASTSIAGSYALVRGASIFIGDFPNEMTIIEEIKQGIVPKTEWQVWAYLAAIIVVALIAFYVQWKYRPEKNSKNKRGDRYFRI